MLPANDSGYGRADAQRAGMLALYTRPHHRHCLCGWHQDAAFSAGATCSCKAVAAKSKVSRYQLPVLWGPQCWILAMMPPPVSVPCTLPNPLPSTYAQDTHTRISTTISCLSPTKKYAPLLRIENQARRSSIIALAAASFHLLPETAGDSTHDGGTGALKLLLLLCGAVPWCRRSRLADSITVVSLVESESSVSGHFCPFLPTSAQ
jgi:hypothetical protein